MLENSVSSVISPEGCAAILWKSSKERDKATVERLIGEAAAALKVTAVDLNRLGIADEVVPEPAGGAHSDWEGMAGDLAEALSRHLAELRCLSAEDLIDQRGKKFLSIGEWRLDA
jgi:acetyl-CoA carboxylase carboxyl transferase subunit alpha